ncbi:DUF6086 family protein [Streptomyces tsukubensis]
MSMYFDNGDELLWNPSNTAGRLFLRQIEVFEAELQLPSGIGQGKHWGDPDTLNVDPALYADFVRGLVAWHCRAGHPVVLALSEGLVATAVVLARRAGIEVEIPEPGHGNGCGGAQRDVQVPGNRGTASAVVGTSLNVQTQKMDGWMAR